MVVNAPTLEYDKLTNYVLEEKNYHLTAASDEQTHHFAEEACLQRVEIVVRLEECVDRVEQ